MNPAAIDKAKQRLDKSKSAIASLEAKPRDRGEAAALWTDFLLAHNSVFSCLEQGAKTESRSRQWFGKKKRERREDPLLQYLHQARNADEHGIAPIARFQPPTARILEGTGNPETIKDIRVSADTIKIQYDDTNGNVPHIRITSPAVYLVPVTDERYGMTFDPPTEHLGKQLENNYPLTVAKLGFAYTENLINEAEQLTLPPKPKSSPKTHPQR